MELMLLVYIVQMIGPLGWLLIVSGLLYFVYRLVMFLVEYETVKSHQAELLRSKSKTLKDRERYVLKKDTNLFRAGETVLLDLYSSHGYIKAGERKEGFNSREAIADALLDKTDTPVVLPPLPKFNLPVVAVVMLLLGVLLPNKETTIYMAGAYMVQQVVTSDTAKEIGNLAADATKAQLKAWASESPELASLLIQSGIQEATATAKQAKMDNL